ncbi:hypothetical protein RHMOL_Rhmol01G0110800 [Rhododendron molle]|uniref:Uncharacterized protein n=1 Tax=Rhododendron molle TaxID=49168 RepID=A0ACC0PZY3_RHOML|nr:hypothetical protein RHMOL_Rhmol01G0110800 [Rhododendron molle]
MKAVFPGLQKHMGSCQTCHITKRRHGSEKRRQLTYHVEGSRMFCTSGFRANRSRRRYYRPNKRRAAWGSVLPNKRSLGRTNHQEQVEDVHHIFENYMMSRYVRYSRYYLCSRRSMMKIIPEGMYDSEKWASDYVEVRGNYEFPPGQDDHVYVAKERGNPNTTKINKNQLRLAKDCSLADSLLTIPREERDASTILQYDATYGGRIKRKGAEGSGKRKSPIVDLPELPEDQLPNPDKPLRGTRAKEEAERKKAGASGASGSAPKPSVPAKKATPDAIPHKHPASPPTSTDKPTKRFKVTTKKASAAAGKSSTAEGQGVEGQPKGKGAEGETQDDDAIWAPSFVTPRNKQILRTDSLIEDPSLGFTLHAGLRLPRDIAAQGSLKTALNDYYYFAGRVSFL